MLTSNSTHSPLLALSSLLLVACGSAPPPPASAPSPPQPTSLIAAVKQAGGALPGLPVRPITSASVLGRTVASKSVDHVVLKDAPCFRSQNTTTSENGFTMLAITYRRMADASADIGYKIAAAGSMDDTQPIGLKLKNVRVRRATLQPDPAACADLKDGSLFDVVTSEGFVENLELGVAQSSAPAAQTELALPVGLTPGAVTKWKKTSDNQVAADGVVLTASTETLRIQYAVARSTIRYDDATGSFQIKNQQKNTWENTQSLGFPGPLKTARVTLKSFDAGAVAVQAIIEGVRGNLDPASPSARLCELEKAVGLPATCLVYVANGSSTLRLRSARMETDNENRENFDVELEYFGAVEK